MAPPGAAPARGPVPGPGAVPPHQRAPWRPGNAPNGARPGGPNAAPNGAPNARVAAAPLKAPRRVPWQRLQCPPIGTPAGRVAWSRWLLVLILVGLLDAVAQAPLVRQLVVNGALNAPPWLSGAFGASSTISGQLDWIPDPVTSWIKAEGTADAATVSSRLAAVSLLLLLCVTLIRRGGTRAWMMTVKTAAGWIGTAVAVLLAFRYLATGFASLLWATAALRWWLVPAALVLALVTSRLAGKAR